MTNEQRKLIQKRDELKMRLEIINVRCDARDKLEKELYQLCDRIATESTYERLAQ